MGKIIDLNGYKNKTVTNKVDQLALFSVFFFNEEYGEQVEALDIEVKYALMIMTYKFLSDAQKDGTLMLNKKGFSIDTEVKTELKDCIETAIKAQAKFLN